MSTFINTACLYLRIKMIEEEGTIQIAWVLLYIEREIAKVKEYLAG